MAGSGELGGMAKRVISRQTQDVISDEVRYHKEMGYKQVLSQDNNDGEEAECRDPGAIIRMLAGVFVYRFLSTLLILFGIFCLLAALAHVNADMIVESYPLMEPHLEVLAMIVERIMVPR